MTEYTLSEVPDLAAIHRLEASYCQLLDAGKWDELTSVFSKDCEMVIAGTAYKGREQVIDLLRGVARGKHILSLPVVNFDTDGDAIVLVDQLFYRYPDLHLAIAGSYRDRVVRSSANRWLIAKREIAMDCVVDDVASILATGR